MTPGPAPGRAADPVRTVFFGSGAFAVPILEALAANPGVELVGVVTAPDRQAGRGRLLRPTPVALLARSMWAPLLQPARLRDDAAVAAVAELRPALGVLADYGQIVPRSILELPDHGTLNVHPSLLPRHRGATPIPAAIASGDARTGVTIIEMDDGVDTGPIVAQEAWPLDGTETAPALEARAAGAAAALLSRTLDPWLDGTLRAVPQGDATAAGEPATLTRPFRRDHARLDPSMSADTLERGVRARTGWPGSYLDTSLGRLLIHRASVETAQDEAGSAPFDPGRLLPHGRGLALQTGDGRLVLDEVQLPGGRVVSGEEMRRGHPEYAEASVARPGRDAKPAEALA